MEFLKMVEDDLGKRQTTASHMMEFMHYSAIPSPINVRSSGRFTPSRTLDLHSLDHILAEAGKDDAALIYWDSISISNFASNHPTDAGKCATDEGSFKDVVPCPSLGESLSILTKH